MSRVKRLAEQMAEERGMTLQEFMSEPYELPEAEPDYSWPDIQEMREQSYLWRSLK